MGVACRGVLLPGRCVSWIVPVRKPRRAIRSRKVFRFQQERVPGCLRRFPAVSRTLDRGHWPTGTISTHAPRVQAVVTDEPGIVDARSLLARPRQKGARGPEPTRGAPVLGSGLAVTMCSYPGVLLGITSNPLWSSGRLLGGLLASSSIHSGAALAQLAHSGAGSADPSTLILHRVERLAAVCQGILAVLFVIESGTAAWPLVRGRHASTFWLGAIAPVLLPARVRRNKQGKSRRSVLLPLLALAGGLALKWAVTHAGREAVKKGDGALIPG